LGGRALLMISIAVLASSACEREPEAPPMRVKRVFHLNPYEKDFGYSQAVLIDKTLYISGSVAADENGRLSRPATWPGKCVPLIPIYAVPWLRMEPTSKKLSKRRFTPRI